MKITLIGTGTSQGVPVIGCKCAVCRSTDPKDKRFRSSVLVEVEDQTIVIDTGPDFRQQMLREEVDKLDAALFTHGHKDHTAGLDDIRAFNFLQKKTMQLYGDERVREVLFREYQYAFVKDKYPGVPDINFNVIDHTKPFEVYDIKIQPILVMHYKLPVLGYRIKNFTYITDANYISEVEKEKLKGTKVLVLNGLRKEKHYSHFNLEEAIALFKEIQPETGLITHISHLMGNHVDVSKELPPNIYLGYDGLSLEW